MKLLKDCTVKILLEVNELIKYVYLIFFSFLLCNFHGVTIEMTKEGAGISYSFLKPINETNLVSLKGGLHFSGDKVDYDFSYQPQHSYSNSFLQFKSEFIHILFNDKIDGTFRPIIITGVGALSETNQLNVWKPLLEVGMGVKFVNNNIRNQLTLSWMSSDLIQGHVSLQLSFYFKGRKHE